jgi:hypothetical protein
LSAAAKPFQRAITEWALRRGSGGDVRGHRARQDIATTRLGARRRDHEDARVLVLTPLGRRRADRRGGREIRHSSVAYAPIGTATTDIVVTNYERFEKFDIDQYAGIVLDESGIIKSQDGKTRAILTEACRETPWRLCCTATPAPNDYTELGQHAEFLGVMTAKEMLSMFFVHDGSIRATITPRG